MINVKQFFIVPFSNHVITGVIYSLIETRWSAVGMSGLCIRPNARLDLKFQFRKDIRS
jgi:hypothetical protein